MFTSSMNSKLSAVQAEPYDIMVTHADRSSTAERVARLAPIPALILRGQRPTLARMLVCTAGGEPGKMDVLVAARIVRRLKAHATLLFVAADGMASEAALRHLAQGADGVHRNKLAQAAQMDFFNLVEHGPHEFGVETNGHGQSLDTH